MKLTHTYALIAASVLGFAACDKTPAETQQKAEDSKAAADTKTDDAKALLFERSESLGLLRRPKIPMGYRRSCRGLDGFRIGAGENLD